MTGKQNAVMWLGILLILTKLFTTDQWSVLWKSLSTGDSSAGGSGGIGGCPKGQIKGPDGKCLTEAT